MRPRNDRRSQGGEESKFEVSWRFLTFPVNLLTVNDVYTRYKEMENCLAQRRVYTSCERKKKVTNYDLSFESNFLWKVKHIFASFRILECFETRLG